MTYGRYSSLYDIHIIIDNDNVSGRGRTYYDILNVYTTTLFITAGIRYEYKVNISLAKLDMT